MKKLFAKKRRFFVLLAFICLLVYFRNALYTHIVAFDFVKEQINTHTHGHAVVTENADLEPGLLTVEELEKLCLLYTSPSPRDS